MSIDVIILLGLNLSAVLVLFAGLWLIALRTRDPSFVDAFWAFGISLCALLSFLTGHADLAQKLVITALCLVWGLRLGLHLFLRWRLEGQDKRYANLIASVREKRGWGFAQTTALFIFLPQAVLLWITALPVQLGQASSQITLTWLFWPGLCLAILGLSLEWLADDQLRRFKSDPANHDKVMDQGLWAWSRHPNYFGEAMFWWGLYLIAAQSWIGAASIIGPAFLTFTLIRWSGVPLMEKTITDHRPDYARYQARTSAFIPLPPGQQSRPD